MPKEVRDGQSGNGVDRLGARLTIPDSLLIRADEVIRPRMRSSVGVIDTMALVVPSFFREVTGYGTTNGVFGETAANQH